MKYFTFKEMIQSDTAKSKDIENIPNWDQINALMNLIKYVLDPLRSLYKKAIRVSSGFRSEALNEAVNGSKTSQHTKGEAADLTAGSKKANMKLFELIRDNLTFDQLIDESDYSWIHVSFTKNNRNQILHLK